MNKKYDCVIWDWNGTLLDDVSASLRSVNDMLGRRNMEPIDIYRYRECIGVPIRCFYEQVFDLQKEDYTALLKEYNEGYDYYVSLDIGIAEGASELLAKTGSNGTKQIIVSSCEKNKLIKAVGDSGIAGYFDAVLGADDFLATSKVGRANDYIKNNLPENARILVVGDLVHDAELASQIGADCILVESGHEDSSRLHSSGAVIAVNAADVENYMNT